MFTFANFYCENFENSIFHSFIGVPQLYKNFYHNLYKMRDCPILNFRHNTFIFGPEHFTKQLVPEIPGISYSWNFQIHCRILTLRRGRFISYLPTHTFRLHAYLVQTLTTNHNKNRALAKFQWKVSLLRHRF